MGETLRISGEYSRAIESLLKAFPYCEKIGNHYQMAFLNMNLGVCYSDYGDYTKAENALFKGLSYFKTPMDSGDSDLIETNYIYIAEMFERKAALDSAQYFANIAYTFDSLTHKNWSWIKIVFGDISAKQQLYIKALNYYKTALLKCQVKNSIDCYNGIAKVFYQPIKLIQVFILLNWL